MGNVERGGENKLTHIENSYFLPFGSVLKRICQALKVFIIRPLSTTFSPSVNWPSIRYSLLSGFVTANSLYCYTKHSDFSMNAWDVLLLESIGEENINWVVRLYALSIISDRGGVGTVHRESQGVLRKIGSDGR